MAELTTIARPYAKAAFRFAQDAGVTAQWENMLALAAAVSEQPAMRAWLQQPQLTASDKAQALLEVCGSDALDEPARNFITQLAEYGRLALLPAILELFHELLAAQDAFVDAEIVSADVLEEAEVERLVSSLKQRLGRDVRVTTRVDASLIGGVLVRAGDTVIDGSVRGRLARLAEQLNS
ncbi:F0F1 ATP synthase subunit delta [Isoalcanivorax beigongshangi]|uniref:ATP synthase subunit delta n=1 Tax=Isoalcanivorax beigongshangi TaxID=3238810 RepID=A0ABV4AG98_9GAMM